MALVQNFGTISHRICISEARDTKTTIMCNLIINMKTSVLVFIGMMSVFLAENCQRDETTWNTWQKGRLKA